jgi:hypothetical protein
MPALIRSRRLWFSATTSSPTSHPANAFVARCRISKSVARRAEATSAETSDVVAHTMTAAIHVHGMIVRASRATIVVMTAVMIVHRVMSARVSSVTPDATTAHHAAATTDAMTVVKVARVSNVTTVVTHVHATIAPLVPVVNSATANSVQTTIVNHDHVTIGHRALVTIARHALEMTAHHAAHAPVASPTHVHHVEPAPTVAAVARRHEARVHLHARSRAVTDSDPGSARLNR